MGFAHAVGTAGNLGLPGRGPISWEEMGERTPGGGAVSYTHLDVYKRQGLEEVPATIIEADDRKVMEPGLIENLQREDLNPMEEAAGYRSLIQDYGLTLCSSLGASLGLVTLTLRP